MQERKEITLKFDELVPDVVRYLNKKEDEWIYKKLIKKFIPNFNNVKSYDEIFQVIASNPNTPVDVLNSLKFFENEDVRESLALNTNTPKNILLELSQDNSPYVRMEVLKRKDVDLEIIEHMCHDHGEYLYNAEEVEDDDFTELIDEDAEDWDDDGLFSDFNEEQFHTTGINNYERIRLLLASNDKTPEEVLKKLSNDENQSIRKAVVLNHNIDFKTLLKLSEDGADAVRASILGTEGKNLRIKLCINQHIEWINR